MTTASVPASAPRAAARNLVIGLIGFLTLVDLFAAQAILPTLVRVYRVTPAAMGFAVNASTMGMAIAGLGVAFFSHWIDRRLGVLISLALLSIPTALLAVAPDLTIFTILRIAQGLCMAAAFAPRAKAWATARGSSCACRSTIRRRRMRLRARTCAMAGPSACSSSRTASIPGTRWGCF